MREERASQRLDNRELKGTSEVPRGARGKKDRKRWCGGHVGREHVLECRPYKGWLGDERGWRERVCTTCGKQLAWYAPPFAGVKWTSHEKKPDWVTM